MVLSQPLQCFSFFPFFFFLVVKLFTFYWASLIAQLIKESAFKAGDSSSILRSEKSTGEGIGYSLHYSWAALVAQLVKNLSATQETWV